MTSAEALLDAHATTPFRSVHGQLTLHAFEIAGTEHAALVGGDPRAVRHPLVRIQSACLTATAFGATLCDCRQQLELAFQRVGEVGGIVLYLAQEGRSHGLVEKVAQLELIASGADTLDAAEQRGRAADLRDYRAAAAILDVLLPDRPAIRLLTNNPAKLSAVESAGIQVAEPVAHEPPPTSSNREYLRVKKHRMGHMLSRV